jgi:hypothetical protein
MLEPLFQPPNRRTVELILMTLQIPQLREMLAAFIKFTSVRFRRRVHDLVRADIAVLGERFPADVAVVGPLAGVAALVGFEVAELGEALAAGGFFAEEGFDAGVRAGVDVEVGFLVEGFVAAGEIGEDVVGLDFGCCWWPGCCLDWMARMRVSMSVLKTEGLVSSELSRELE